MSNDRAIGSGLLVLCVVVFTAYFWLVFLSPWGLLTVQVSAVLAVGAILFVSSWIGYSMLTTPEPVLLDDLDEKDYPDFIDSVSFKSDEKS